MTKGANCFQMDGFQEIQLMRISVTEKYFKFVILVIIQTLLKPLRSIMSNVKYLMITNN